MINILHLVRAASADVHNGRTLLDVIRHLKSEVVELDEEVVGAEGADGVVGESIDVILCALDAIFVYDELVTDEEIESIIIKKLAKWRRRYSSSIDGDRTID